MISRVLAKLILGSVARLHVLRPEVGANTGPWLLAANHISHFDPPILSVATKRKIDWMAMIELFKHRWGAAWLRAIETFPTDRSQVDRRSAKTALSRLKQGHVVGIFPEGGIRDGTASVLEGAPIQPGIAALAQLERVPIVPCVILGADRLYNKTHWLPPRRAVNVWVGFGSPITAPRGLDKAAQRAFLERELAAALRRLQMELVEHYGLEKADLPHPPRLRMEGR